MKDKTIDFRSCVSIFQPCMRRSFATVSPVSIITGDGLVYSWAGSVSYTSNPSVCFGTIDRLRLDPKDNQPLNRDQWTLNSTGTPSLIRILEIQKEDIFEHHSDKLPSDMKDDSPSWVRHLVDEKLQDWGAN